MPFDKLKALSLADGLKVHPEPIDFPQGHEQVDWSRFYPVFKDGASRGRTGELELMPLSRAERDFRDRGTPVWGRIHPRPETVVFCSRGKSGLFPLI